MEFHLEDYIERLMSAWSNSFRKIQGEIMQHSELGLTGPQFQMLGIIYRNKSCNVSYLSEKLDVRPSAITVMTDRLVQRGYIERQHDEQDRRAVLLKVTELGSQVYQEAGKRAREVLKYYLSDFSEEDMEVLIRITENIALKESMSAAKE